MFLQRNGYLYTVSTAVVFCCINVHAGRNRIHHFSSVYCTKHMVHKCAYNTKPSLSSVPTGSPMNVTAIASGPTTLLVHWNPPPPEERNGDIIQYGLNITNVELGETTTHYLSGSRTSFILQNLRPHNVYQYRMTAYTAVGNGPYSPSQTIEMPSAGT